MNRAFVITGTDTDVGKTVASAMLVQALEADYFKPIQAGLDDETDTQAVQRLCRIGDCRIIPELYRLATPASPHYAAEIDDIEIDTESLKLPDRARPLIVEGAGGLMVPVNHSTLFIDVFKIWRRPVILCARTSLGTINHSLLSVLALNAADIDIHGIIFIGDPNPSSESAICEFGRLRRLGRIPFLDDLNAETLRQVFENEFHMEDFA